MSQASGLRIMGMVALVMAFGGFSVRADHIKKVFVIAMENHNWTQPINPFGPGVQQVFQNPNAPFINSLVYGSAVAVIHGSVVHKLTRGGDCPLQQAEEAVRGALPFLCIRFSAV